jgi:hypothetical protein
MAQKVLSVGEIQEIASGQRNRDWDFAKQHAIPDVRIVGYCRQVRRALVPLAANLPAHGRRSVRDANKVRTLGVRFAHQSA